MSLQFFHFHSLHLAKSHWAIRMYFFSSEKAWQVSLICQEAGERLTSDVEALEVREREEEEEEDTGGRRAWWWGIDDTG